MAQISCSEDSDMLHILRANISKSGKLAIIDLKMLEKVVEMIDVMMTNDDVGGCVRMRVLRGH